MVLKRGRGIMGRTRLFDWIAENREDKRKRVVSREKIPAGCPVKHWRMIDDRPIFRISAVAALTRDPDKIYRQKTNIVHILSNSSFGGFVYPTGSLNASYVFRQGKDVKALENDNDKLCECLGWDRRKLGKNLQAYEWDLELRYNVKHNEDPFTKAKAWIVSAEYRPRIRPQFSSALSIPSNHQDWRCIDSGTTRQALESLSAALAAGEPPLVLITGLPGSGKEAYAAALHYGRVENWDEGKAEPKKAASNCYKICALGSIDVRKLDEWLTQELNHIKDDGGTVFFDETDKSDPTVRSHLLRLLEEKKYQPLNVKADKINCEKITFVVGAGKRLNALRNENPPDFWTRMEFHIEVGDPLMAPTNEDRRKVIDSFFRHFWWDSVSRWVEGVVGMPYLDWKDVFEIHPFAEEIGNAVFDFAIGKVRGGVLKISPPVKEIAELFAENLAPHLERRELSVRGLRSCVKSITWALGSSLIGLATGNKKIREKEFMERSRQAVVQAIGTVIQVLPA